MDYEITIDGNRKALELIPSSSGSSTEEYSAKIEGKSARVTVLKRENAKLIISINDRVYSLIQTERSKFSVSFIANDVSIRATLGGDQNTGGSEASSLIATANELVASNFPAKIVKLLVKKGDAPKEGDTLVILEAMKMEAQIKAPHDCTVEEVFVKEGEMVERGKSLIKLKFA